MLDYKEPEKNIQLDSMVLTWSDLSIIQDFFIDAIQPEADGKPLIELPNYLKVFLNDTEENNLDSLLCKTLQSDGSGLSQTHLQQHSDLPQEGLSISAQKQQLDSNVLYLLFTSEKVKEIPVPKQPKDIPKEERKQYLLKEHIKMLLKSPIVNIDSLIPLIKTNDQQIA